MKKTLLAALTLALAIAPSGVLRARSDEPAGGSNATELVAKLSWDSVYYEKEGWQQTPQVDGTAVQELLHIGIPATPALLAALRDPNRAVAAQLVLARIWFPKRMFLDGRHVYRDGEFVARYYRVLDLGWSVPTDVHNSSVLDVSSVGPALKAWCDYLARQATADVCKEPAPSRAS